MTAARAGRYFASNVASQREETAMNPAVHIRRAVALATVTALLACAAPAAAAPVSAQNSIPGDGVAPGTYAALPFDYSADSLGYDEEGSIDYDDVYAIPLVAGKKFTAVMEPHGEGANLGLALYAPGTTDLSSLSTALVVATDTEIGGANVKLLEFTVPESGTYVLDAFMYQDSAPGSYDLFASVSKWSVTKLSVPSKVGNWKFFTVSARVAPTFDNDFADASFEFQVYERGHWVGKGSLAAAVETKDGYTRVYTSARVKGSSHSWRVRAIFKDNVMNTTTKTSWKKFRHR
jgi:hypothetical protein